MKQRYEQSNLNKKLTFFWGGGKTAPPPPKGIDVLLALASARKPLNLWTGPLALSRALSTINNRKDFSISPPQKKTH